MLVELSTGEMGLISPIFSRAAFRSIDPKSTIRQSSHQGLFALLGSLRAKVARTMLVKLTHGGVGNLFSSMYLSLLTRTGEKKSKRNGTHGCLFLRVRTCMDA